MNFTKRLIKGKHMSSNYNFSKTLSEDDIASNLYNTFGKDTIEAGKKVFGVDYYVRNNKQRNIGVQNIHTPVETILTKCDLKSLIEEHIKDSLIIKTTNPEFNNYVLECIDKNKKFIYESDNKRKSIYALYLFKRFNVSKNNYFINRTYVDKETEMKADLILSNPNWGTGVGHADEDIKLLVKALDATTSNGKLVFVMTDRILTHKTGKYPEYRDKLDKYCESIHIFDMYETFKVNHFSNCCIIIVDKNKKNSGILINDTIHNLKYTLNSLHDYSEFGPLTEEELHYEQEMKKIQLWSKKVEEWEQRGSNEPYKNNLIDVCTFNKIDTTTNFKYAHFIVGGANWGNGDIKTIVPKNTKHIVDLTNKQQIENILANKGEKETAKKWFTYHPNLQQIDNFIFSVTQPIFKWYIGLFKPSKTINASLFKQLPNIINSDGTVNRITNNDWKRILHMPDSYAEKVLAKMST